MGIHQWEQISTETSGIEKEIVLDAEHFESWAIIELFGHRRLAGKVTEATIAGGSFIRIDVPAEADKFITKFYGPAAIYSMSPCDEALARMVAKNIEPAPIERWEISHLLNQPPQVSFPKASVEFEQNLDDDDHPL